MRLDDTYTENDTTFWELLSLVMITICFIRYSVDAKVHGGHAFVFLELGTNLIGHRFCPGYDR